MAHNLDITEDIASFVTAREDAWHKLGVTLPGTFTAEEAMEHAHLGGWNVRKVPLSAHDITPDGVTVVDVPGKFATVRTNPVTKDVEPLGVVGDRYTVIQNEAHAEFLNTLVDESGAHFETAGALFGGRQVFISMKMPNHIEVGGDVTDLYLIGRNAHDGTSPFEVFTSAIRPVCHNTVTAALRGAKSKHSIRHTSSATGRVQEAREALGMAFKYADAYKDAMEALIARKMDNRGFERFLDKLFEVKDREDTSTRKLNQMDAVRALWSGSPTLQDTKGTRLGAFQALTEYTSHFSEAHGRTRQEREVNRAQRDVLDSKLRTRALELLAA